VDRHDTDLAFAAVELAFDFDIALREPVQEVLERWRMFLTEGLRFVEEFVDGVEGLVVEACPNGLASTDFVRWAGCVEDTG